MIAYMMVISSVGKKDRMEVREGSVVNDIYVFGESVSVNLTLSRDRWETAGLVDGRGEWLSRKHNRELT